MKLTEIKKASEQELLLAQAKAMNAQGEGPKFSQMLENRINKIQAELDKRQFKKYIDQDSHYFSKGHLQCWFKDRYLGKTKAEITFDLNVNHDNSGEIENAEDELKRKLTDKEETHLLYKFHKSVIGNIEFRRGIAIGYIDSLNNFNQ